MHFWTKFGYLLLILIYVEIRSSGYEFRAMPLGHTGLLIYWDPQGAYDYEKLFFKYHAVGKIATANISEKEYTKNGQHKLNSTLIENTEYEITIREEDSDKKQIIKAKTGLKKNSFPQKPGFKWDLERIWRKSNIRITWMPCGKERNCRGNEAGTHFAVRFKVLDMRETWTVVQNVTDFVDIPYIYFGQIYEVIVSSINGDIETDSDSQEIFHVPSSSPVHAVRVLTLTNTSIYVSWKKPRHSVDVIVDYNLYISIPIHSSNELNAMSLFIPQYDERFGCRVNGFTPKTPFTVSIVPYPSYSLHPPGYAYRFDYSIPAIQANLTLAKSDFKFIYFKTDRGGCSYEVSWIPCGETHDCKNMSPGSGFELKIQYGNDAPKTIIEKLKSQTRIKIKRDEIATVTAKAVNEFNESSDSVTETLNCD